MEEQMEIGGAVAALRNGKKVARAGWNGKNMHLEMHDGHPELGGWRSFVVIKDATDMRVPWNASQADLLADDWVTVP